MRIVMMGTGPFAVPTFRWLIESEHDLPMLITRPPRTGRGKRKPPPNPMHEVALQNGLAVAMPDSINEDSALELLQGLAADLFVVCDYGQILSAEALGTARLGGINLHASLLPLYRGAAPINWAIYDGQARTGVTVIHMTKRLDAGPNLVQNAVDIEPDETAVELEERLAEIGVGAIAEAIEMLAKWDGASSIGERQDPKLATKAPRLKRNDGLVDWNRSAIEISNQTRAFKPWPGTFTYWLRPEGEPLRVILAQVHATSAEIVDKPPGTVTCVDGALLIATGDGVLQIESIQPSGKNRQPWDAFLRGYRLQVGDRFGTPA